MVNEHNDRSITIKTADEIAIMHRANQIVSGVLALLESEIREGVSTLELDKIAETFCHDHHALPALKDTKGIPRVFVPLSMKKSCMAFHPIKKFFEMGISFRLILEPCLTDFV